MDDETPSTKSDEKWVDDLEFGEARILDFAEWDEVMFVRHGYGGNQYERLYCHRETGAFVIVDSPEHEGHPEVRRLSEKGVIRWCIESDLEFPPSLRTWKEKFAFHPSDPSQQTPSAEIFAQLPPSPMKGKGQNPSDELAKAYSDPGNYWRNVWLYQQREAEKTNSRILADLAAIAPTKKWAIIETDGGLNNALKTIAAHHQWTLLKGRNGRPRKEASQDEPAPSRSAPPVDGDDIPF